MALINEILVGRYNRFAQKLLGMKGPAALPQLANELRLTVPLFHASENRYLEGWDLFGIGRFQAAPGAGNGSTLTLRNPAGSNMVAVITRLAWEEATAGGAGITLFPPGSNGAAAGDENTVLIARGWDSRGRPGSTLVISTNSAAAVGRLGGILISNVQILAATTYEHLPYPHEIPMLPGTLLTVTGSTLNEAMTATAWWRERFLEDSERA